MRRGVAPSCNLLPGRVRDTEKIHTLRPSVGWIDATTCFSPRNRHLFPATNSINVGLLVTQDSYLVLDKFPSRKENFAFILW